MRRRLLILLVLCLAPARGQMELAYQRGTVGLLAELARLQTTARVLHVGAHPDDEDSGLLAYLARGLGVRTAYLSLNRGEGGQNAIGPELFEPLGIIRTEELLAARRLDGAEQYFTNVMDFGFSKSAEESLEFWGREQTLGEVVAVIRRFRPHVVITRFLGNAGDGHGHHQAAGLLIREAFRTAGDADAYPDQGLPAWQATRLYAARWNLTDAPQQLPVGEFSPVYGRSYLSIALEGRSQHRSQDMGRTYLRGPATTPLVLLDSTDDSDPAGAWDAGFRFALEDLVPAEGEEPWRQPLHTALANAAGAVDEAVAFLEPGIYPRRACTALAEAVRELRRADEVLTAGRVPETTEAYTWRLAVRQKLAEAQRALLLAAGIELDALAERPEVAAGEVFAVTANAYWPAVARVESPRLRLDAPAGWATQALPEPPTYGDGRASVQAGYRVEIPLDAAAEQPHWLAEPRQGARFVPDGSVPVGEPFAAPRLLVNLRALVDGEAVSVSVPVVHRSSNPVRGERRRAVAVLPPVSAEVVPDQVLTAPDQPGTVVASVTLQNHSSRAVAGTLHAAAGDTAVPLDLARVALEPGERRRFDLTLSLPALAEPAPVRLSLDALPLRTVHRIEYEHIAPHLWHTPAGLRVVPVEAKVAPGLRVGYIPGPGDDIPAALGRLGLAVTVLDEAALTAGAFGELNVIVVGIRAYETNAALRRHNGALLDWLRAGGLLVVQYQQYEYQQGGYAPQSVTYARPHDRVTDETAEVTLLQPDHPLLTAPNRIGGADFAGWQQERALYMWRSWHADYTPLLACADPGEEPREGGLLVAEVGAGKFIYCAYALFRQTPAGVPGAYRLLANLVSYGR